MKSSMILESGGSRVASVLPNMGKGAGSSMLANSRMPKVIFRSMSGGRWLVDIFWPAGCHQNRQHTAARATISPMSVRL